MSRFFLSARSVLPSSRTLIGAMLLGIAASSSADEPRVVVLLPHLTGPPGQIAVPRTLELTVRDDRDSKIIGSRGGVFISNFVINSEDDISPGLSEILSQELERQGYAVIAPGTGGELTLTVAVKELTYEMSGAVATDVKLSAAVEAVCTKGDSTLTSRYRTNHTDEFAFPPKQEKNGELINMVLGKSLDQMLADSELREFMSK